MVYHHIGIAKLSPAQTYKLKQGQGSDRAKLGCHYTKRIIQRQDQIQKLHLKKGWVVIIS